MGIRWWLFSGEESITGVELGLWAQTWGSRRSPAWSLLDFRLPSPTASFFCLSLSHRHSCLVLCAVGELTVGDLSFYHDLEPVIFHGGNFVPQRTFGNVWRYICLSHLEADATDIWWVRCSTLYSAWDSPHHKERHSPKCSNAKVEKPALDLKLHEI